MLVLNVKIFFKGNVDILIVDKILSKFLNKDWSVDDLFKIREFVKYF